MKTKRIVAVLLTASLAIMSIGCSNNSNKATETSNTKKEVKESSRASKEEVGQIILKGSSTLAPVINEISKKFTDENKAWDKVNDKYGNEEIDLAVTGGGSGAGVKSMIDGSAAFGLVSRPVTEDEKSKIKDYKEFNLGMDALTVSVNPENEICKYKNDFTTEELRKIFSGEYKYWDEVNENLSHDEIVLVTRDIGGGAHKVFQKKVMGDKDVSENVIQAPSMGALVTKIIENKNAIGYASFGVVNQNEGKITPLKVDGVEPTAENIQSGDYKISRPLLVISSGDLNDAQKALIDEFTSEEGMEIVKKLGFVPAK